MGVEGRTAVVTGASRGIGASTADMLEAEGARVLRTSRADGIDVTAPDAAELIAERAPGPVDILVNNAGTSVNKALSDLSDEDWERQWQLNVMGPMRLMRAAVPRMADAGWGRVVNVASSSGKRPSPSNAAYSVAKAAELSLSRVYADACAGAGVCVNAVAPGATASELWTGPGGLAEQAARRQGTTRDEALEAAAGKIPRGRLGEPDEIAAVIVFLCSEAAANVAGAAWSVDGGTVATIV